MKREAFFERGELALFGNHSARRVARGRSWLEPRTRNTHGISMPPLIPAGDGADREPHAKTRAQPARVPLPMGARGILHRRLRKDAILQTSSVYVCTSNAAARHSGRHASTWQEHSTGLEWMRFSRETHLLLYGTSHLQAVAGALRVAARHLGTLTRTETLSHSNPRHSAACCRRMATP